MSDNSWFEKGEFPPVGAECEAFRDYRWVKCEIKAHMKQAGQSCAFYQMDNCWGFDERPSKFRPIKTERDIAIEDMAIIMNDNTNSTFTEIAGLLYDAGYRKNA